ncbi:hypothetical protein ACNI65_16170 [Roseateles sp. So40a]|uniref:hypothetical protein n=1 Tax=Roseateles sp. So40a TaxID=3400226 RepID=UPI003A8B4867
MKRFAAMRHGRLLAMLCAAALAGLALVYALALLMGLADGRMVEFGRFSAGRSYTWADAPGMVVAHALAHLALLSAIVFLAVRAWKRPPSNLPSLLDSPVAMTASQWAAMSCIALTAVATFIAVTFGLTAGMWRRPAIAVIWLLWAGSCALLPLWGWVRGKFGTGFGRVVRRSHDPGGFWYRWITVTAWSVLMLVVASVVCWVEW